MLVLIYLVFFGYWAYLLTIMGPAGINREAGRAVVVLTPSQKLWWAVIVMVIPILGVVIVSYQLSRFCRRCGFFKPFPKAICTHCEVGA